MSEGGTCGGGGHRCAPDEEDVADPAGVVVQGGGGGGGDRKGPLAPFSPAGSSSSQYRWTLELVLRETLAHQAQPDLHGTVSFCFKSGRAEEKVDLWPVRRQLLAAEPALGVRGGSSRRSSLE